jgi:hypothetical protein
MVNVEVWNWPDGKLQYGDGDRTTAVETRKNKREHTPDVDGRKTQAEHVVDALANPGIEWRKTHRYRLA